MVLDAILAALNSLGALLSGMLGVAGLIWNFRSPDGRFTRAGVAMLCGIAVSSASAVVASVVSVYKAQTETVEQLARNEALLFQVSRAIQPITKMDIRARFEIIPRTEFLKGYVAELERNAQPLWPQLSRLPSEIDVPGLYTVSSDADGEVTQVEFDEHYGLWPKGRYETIGLAAKYLSLDTYVFRKPFKVAAQVDFQQADFRAFNLATHENGRLRWDRKARKLYIIAEYSLDRKWWDMNGAVTSIADLAGSQIIFSANVRDKLDPVRGESAQDVVQNCIIDELELRPSEGRTITLSRGEIRMMPAESESGFATVQLPPSLK